MRYATMLALATAGISGISNFLNKIAVTAVKDPILFTTLKNTIVGLFLIGIVLAARKHRDITSLTKHQLLKLFAIGVIGGSLPFALFFTGLSKTSALNAGLIHKTLFLWVLILAIPLLKERVGAWQWAGVGALFAANALVGGFTGFAYNTGELMILAATILWAIENIIAKIALKDISSVTVAAARMIIGSLLLISFVIWRGGASAVVTLNSTQWSWTILTSVLLTGYVLTWYAALARAPATYVATLLVPATLITNVLSALFITHSLTAIQILSSVLFAAGTILVVFFAKETAETYAAPPHNSLERAS
jgi:drug/metabolite transporter (DMT)-like permease